MSHQLDMTMAADDIATMIRYYRNKSGLSQKDLAHLAGIGKTVVFDIEKGKTSIRLNTLLKILEVLNIQMKFETPIQMDEN